MKSFSEIKQQAKGLMQGKVLKLASVTFFPIYISGFIYGVLTAPNVMVVNGEVMFVDHHKPYDLIYSIILTIIGYMITYNLMNWMKTKDDSLLSFKGLFSLFDNLDLFIKMLLASLLMSLIGLLTLIPIAGLIAVIILQFMFVMVPNVMIDDPEIGIIEAFQTSANLMGGHKFNLLLFGLSFIGWIILMALSLGFAGIYVLPYMMIANIIYYNELKKKKELTNENR